jgi:hypothetical protein
MHEHFVTILTLSCMNRTASGVCGALSCGMSKEGMFALNAVGSQSGGAPRGTWP